MKSYFDRKEERRMRTIKDMVQAEKQSVNSLICAEFAEHGIGNDLTDDEKRIRYEFTKKIQENNSMTLTWEQADAETERYLHEGTISFRGSRSEDDVCRNAVKDPETIHMGYTVYEAAMVIQAVDFVYRQNPEFWDTNPKLLDLARKMFFTHVGEYFAYTWNPVISYWNTDYLRSVMSRPATNMYGRFLMMMPECVACDKDEFASKYAMFVFGNRNVPYCVFYPNMIEATWMLAKEVGKDAAFAVLGSLPPSDYGYRRIPVSSLNTVEEDLAILKKVMERGAENSISVNDKQFEYDQNLMEKINKGAYKGYRLRLAGLFTREELEVLGNAKVPEPVLTNFTEDNGAGMYFSMKETIRKEKEREHGCEPVHDKRICSRKRR
jgi:hypothetical protein